MSSFTDRSEDGLDEAGWAREMARPLPRKALDVPAGSTPPSLPHCHLKCGDAPECPWCSGTFPALREAITARYSAGFDYPEDEDGDEDGDPLSPHNIGRHL